MEIACLALSRMTAVIRILPVTLGSPKHFSSFLSTRRLLSGAWHTAKRLVAAKHNWLEVVQSKQGSSVRASRTHEPRVAWSTALGRHITHSSRRWPAWLCTTRAGQSTRRRVETNPASHRHVSVPSIVKSYLAALTRHWLSLREVQRPWADGGMHQLSGACSGDILYIQYIRLQQSTGDGLNR